MASRTKKAYVSKAKTTSIRITSRASVKVTTPKGDNFYTVEYCEERSIPEDADLIQERKILWDEANMECDKQIEDIFKAYQK